jgi:hypothetical protein
VRNVMESVMESPMMQRRPKPITPTAHGAIDYSTVAMTAAAPKLLDMPERAAMAAYGLAAGYLGLSMLTNYKLSAKRAVPFKAHGMTEAAIGMALPALPWVLGFADNKKARNFFLGLTAITFVVSALTDWREDG